MTNELVVGVDVSKYFSEMAIFDPSHKLYGNTFQVPHTKTGFDDLLKTTTDLESQFKTKPVFIMESTSHYYRALSEFLHNNGYKAYVVNPLQIKSFSNVNIRKVKNDRVDAQLIAKFYLAGYITEHTLFNPRFCNLRTVVRHYHDLIKLQTHQKIRLLAVLDLTFPSFHKLFPDSACPTALEILQLYPTPQSALKADPDRLKTIIRTKAPRLKLQEIKAKISKFKELAAESAFVSVDAQANLLRMQTLIEILWTSNTQINRYLSVIRQTTRSMPDYQYLSTIPGIGPITGVTILAEIGDISFFKNARQITAYAGIDPSVRKSGQFTGTHNKMSKRGSPYLRSAFYLAAKAAIYSNWTKNLQAQTKLREFYEKKKAEGKKPKVALGAVMRKLVHYTHAVLRNKQPFTINE